MKKVFRLFFVSACFGFMGLVLWVGSGSAEPPVPNQNPGSLVSPLGGAILAALRQHVAPVPQTGQTIISQAGDDGDIQAGVVPPSPRFTDNGDGTITDNLTRLIWLQEVNCFEAENWFNALTDANTLNSGECGLTDGSVEGDWRLPNIRELMSLIDYGMRLPASSFPGIETSSYWTSTSSPAALHGPWNVSFEDGEPHQIGKPLLTAAFVLPVRGGS
jgi:hypothetical protein